MNKIVLLNNLDRHDIPELSDILDSKGYQAIKAVSHQGLDEAVLVVERVRGNQNLFGQDSLIELALASHKGVLLTEIDENGHHLISQHLGFAAVSDAMFLHRSADGGLHTRFLNALPPANFAPRNGVRDPE